MIKKHEEQLQAFEEKIRAEEKESAKVNSKIEIKDLVDKLSQDHEQATKTAQEKYDADFARSKKATSIVICMQNFVRKML